MKFKKLFVLLLLLMIFCAPMGVKANEEAEGDSNTKDKVSVYLFHGDTCPHCKDAIKFFNKLKLEEGEYFRLIKYEVWNDSTNSKLMEAVIQALDAKADGVPFIVIGEKTFNGYSASLDSEILSAIKTEYDKEERKDVVKSLNLPGNAEIDEDVKESIIPSIIITSSVIILIGFIVLARVKSNKK